MLILIFNYCQKDSFYSDESQSQIIIIMMNFPFTDINELNLPKTCVTEFPDPDDLLNFKLIIFPDEGFYKNGRFVFNFKVIGATAVSMTYFLKN